MKRILSNFTMFQMILVASIVCAKATHSNDDAICKNPFFFGADFPLEEIAVWKEAQPNIGTFHPMRFLDRTEDGFILRSSYGYVTVSYDFETDQIMQLGGNGSLPKWIHDAAIDVGPVIITHFINYILNVGGWQILDVKMSGKEFEEIYLFHGERHDEIEACEVPDCGCVGIAKIYDFDGHLGPKFYMAWRR